MMPEVRHRATRLDKVAKRAKLDDQDLLRPPGGYLLRRPQAGHFDQIHISRQIFECLENGGVQSRVGRTDAGRQRADEVERRLNSRRSSALANELASRAEGGWGHPDPRP